jgi:hypothetical protein
MQDLLIPVLLTFTPTTDITFCQTNEPGFWGFAGWSESDQVIVIQNTEVACYRCFAISDTWLISEPSNTACFDACHPE